VSSEAPVTPAALDAGVDFEAALVEAGPVDVDEDDADAGSEVPFVVPDEDAQSDGALPEVAGAPVISQEELAAAETEEGERLSDEAPTAGGASEPVDESVVDLSPAAPAFPEAQASIAEVAAKAAGAGLPGPDEAGTTSPGPDTAESAANGAAPAEPVLIEVWRLHRRHRDGAGAPRHRGQRPRGAQGAAQGGERQPEQGPEKARGPRPPGPERTRGRDRRPEERKGEDRRPEGAQARGPNRRDGGRPGRQDRGPPRNDERRVPERRDRAPDPNSPFAKLLALKAQLEGRKGDDG
jgi:ATP-dependent RNA helicase SUPV3L1/SUV3